VLSAKGAATAILSYRTLPRETCSSSHGDGRAGGAPVQ